MEESGASKIRQTIDKDIQKVAIGLLDELQALISALKKHPPDFTKFCQSNLSTRPTIINSGSRAKQPKLGEGSKHSGKKDVDGSHDRCPKLSNSSGSKRVNEDNDGPLTKRPKLAEGSGSKQVKEDDKGSCAKQPKSDIGSSSKPSEPNADEKVTGAQLLEEENVDQGLCKICFEKEVSVVFRPCSHLVCCDACAPPLTTCPICRSKIKQRFQVYMS